MNSVIWKFPVDIDDIFEIEMPRGAQILTVQMQGGAGDPVAPGSPFYKPYIWAHVDPSAPTQRRKFAIIGTGHPFLNNGGWEYVGTFQMPPFVWHLFVVSDTLI